MLVLSDSFPTALVTIYFFYGLSFFVLGFGILALNPSKSSLRLSKIFWSLALFGIFHAAYEWGEMFVAIYKWYNHTIAADALEFFAQGSAIVSFYFLMYFAVNAFVAAKPKKFRGVLWYAIIAILMPILIFISFILQGGFSSVTIVSFIRFEVGFPGAVLTGLAFLYWRKEAEIKELNSKWVDTGFLVCGIAFIFYAFFTGLIVPKADYFPANIFNYENFIRFFGVPVQFFRMLCAFVLSIFAFGILNIFNIENLRIKESAELEEAYISLIRSFSKPIELHVPLVENLHIMVAQLVHAIANEMDLSKAQTKGLNLVSWIYDVGKLFIPRELLVKPKNMLRTQDFKIIEMYPEYSYELLKDLKQIPWPLADIAREHREYLDGTGYPRGLRGDEICLEARVLNVADSIVSLISKRAHRDAVPLETAIEEIKKGKGILYDPEVVNACVKLFTEKKFQFIKNSEEVQFK